MTLSVSDPFLPCSPLASSLPLLPPQHLFTGSNGLSVGENPVIDNTEPTPGYTWSTMGEVLEAAGVSWKVYQQEDNFDDNAFAFFEAYKTAKPGDALYDKGMARVEDLIDAFDADMAAGTLPQVSWIVGPANVSEHATWWPSAGEDFTARILARLAAHPDVYAKTAFFLNYDEGGQFFDHAVSPTPPLDASSGVSTVSTVGEVSKIGLPVGMGFRVPLLVVSPWSRGHAVVSQVFDHTSVIRFVETRFNVTCPTISPWRRAMAGDLTSAFDWNSFDASWPTLPDTSGYVNAADKECHTMPAPHIPAAQGYPIQESGTRVSRPLPYTLLVSDTVSAAALTLTLDNAGAAGAPLHAYDVINLKAVRPRMYALAAGTSLSDALPLQAGSSSYSFALHGPNGFLRAFAGDVAAAGGLSMRLSAAVSYSDAAGATPRLVVALANADTSVAVTYSCVDNAYGAAPRSGPLAPGASASLAYDISAPTVGFWYDLSCTMTPAAPQQDMSVSAATPLFERRFMGRMETGRAGISDPAMAAGLPGFAHDVAARNGAFGAVLTPGSLTAAALAALPHPDLPLAFQAPVRNAKPTDKDHQWVWQPEL